MRKAKVKRGTAAGNLHFGPSVHSVEQRGKASSECKIWLEGSNDPASLQLLFVSEIIGRVLCGLHTTDEPWV